MSIAIVTDSTCDIPAELASAHAIEIVPQHILWGTQSYRDGTELTTQQFYARLEHASELPKTSQPAPGDFADAYQRACTRINADAVLCITVASTLSGTFNSAESARSMVDFPVRVVDSHTVSMGLGFAALAAAQAQEAGATLDGTAQVAIRAAQASQILFTLNTLEFLHRGGRIGGARRLIGTALSIKPILEIKEGQVQSVESVRSRKRALARLIELAQRRISKPVQIAILQSATDDEADCFADDVEKILNPTRLIRSTFCAAIGVHTGPGVIGFVFNEAG